MASKMFCFQCQEAFGGKGCIFFGRCGKKPEVAIMQDLLIYVTKGLSCVTTLLRKEGKQIDSKVNHCITQNLFVTITNTNFDREAIIRRIKRTLQIKEALLAEADNVSSLPEAAMWKAPDSGFKEKALDIGILATENENIRSLREIIVYGLKGLAAYIMHANALLKDDDETDAFIQESLAKTLDDTLDMNELIRLALETGKYGVKGMLLLNSAELANLY